MILAWLGAGAVGLSLGLLGSGGAILTVPILVYLVGHDEKSAIAESLAIVASIAIAGMIRAAAQGRVNLRSAMLLAVPGIAGTYLGAHLATHVPGTVQLALLAVLMLTASTMMFKSGGGKRQKSAQQSLDRCANATPDGKPAASRGVWIILLQGVGLGLATGLVGVGGGFLIVPVLVILQRLPMPTAVGTSLAIIAVNSSTGFLKYWSMLGTHVTPPGNALHIDWSIIAVFATLGIAGSLVGNALAGSINQNTLKRIFAVFLVVMAIYILFRQAPRVMPGIFGQPNPAAANERTASAPRVELPQGKDD